jgi:membrane protein EpsK
VKKRKAKGQGSGIREEALSSERNLKKQFLPNLLGNGGVFILNIFIGLWYTPYLIHNLGVAAYGLVPLANSLTSYLSLVNLSINGAAGRFLTLDLEKEDFTSANRTFNTVLVGNVGIVTLTLPFVIGLVLVAPQWFDIPPGHERYAQWLFAATLFSYLFTIIQSSFSVSSWARNRFDLRNAVIAIDRITRVGIVVAAFSITQPALWHVGLGFLGASVIGFVGDFFLWRHLTPQLRIQPSRFDRSRVRQMFGMGGWLVVNQVGALLFNNVDLIVANTMLGAEIAGKYGSVLLFSTMLRRLGQTASTVLTPTILTKYAHGDLDAVNRISKQAVKFLGLAMALPIGVLSGLAQPLLVLWLGPYFQDLASLLVMLTAHLVINLAVLPLFGLNIAFNKVRLPGIVTLSLGVFNIGLAIVFVKFGWGALGIAAASAIVLTAKNMIFTPIYAAIIQKLPWWKFMPIMMPGGIAALSTAGITYGMTRLVNLYSWFVLIAVLGIISLLYVLIVYFLVLDRDDRKLLVALLPSEKTKHILGFMVAR